MSFSQIPNDWRVPGVYIEFDSSGAGTSTTSKRALLIGESDAGSATALTPTQVGNAASGEALFGAGTMLANMVAAFRAGNATMELWGLKLTGNAQVGDAIAALGDERYDYIAFPYTDDASLDTLETELASRWDAMRNIPGRAFVAYKGGLAASSAFGNSRNSQHVCCMAMGESSDEPYLWAATVCGVASKSLANDPAQPLQYLELPGLNPQAIDKRFSATENNVLLYDGMSTHRVQRTGVVQIERLITMYQLNEAGSPDTAYLDLNTPETLDAIRDKQRGYILTRYPRYKLVRDGTEFGAGQQIVTPNLIRTSLLELYREMEDSGWVEDFEAYNASLVVEIDADNPTRVNVFDEPNLVNQFRMYAQRSSFIV